MYLADGDDCAEWQQAAVLCGQQQLGVVRETEGLGRRPVVA